MYEQYVKPDVLDRFEILNYGHALEILHESFPEELNEVQNCLQQ